MNLIKFKYPSVFSVRSVNFRGQQLLTNQVAATVQAYVYVNVVVQIHADHPSSMIGLISRSINDATQSYL